jgi:hypothetical protein
MAESSSLLDFHLLIVEGLSTLHCVSDRLGTINKLIAHVLVLLHCLAVDWHVP